jgi:hypothetical protein
MNKPYTLCNVPFRIMRPALALLSASCQIAMVQAYTKDWPHQELARKVFLLKDKTDALKNPKRDTMQTHIAAWYGLTLDLQAAVADTHPELARLLASATKEVGWIEPAWQFMQERMKSWVAENGAVQ